MSFWKQEPPKPTDDFKNLEPIRLSIPMARATSLTSAPVFSHNSDIALMDEIRCAKNAFAVNLDNSEDQTLVVNILSVATQLAYTSTKAWIASCPSGVVSPPIKIRSGCNKSSTAVPSAKNSGLDKIWNCTPFPVWSSIFLIASAVRTGKVDFSTTILLSLATWAIWRAHNSTYFKSAAIPFPFP